MGSLSLVQAVNQALDTAMAADQRVVCFGEDVGQFGGVFRATQGLQKKYGKARCFNTPLTEQGIVGFAIGMAAQGAVPVAEIQFADYIYPAFDQLVNEAAKYRYRSGNQFNVAGLTVRAPYGGGIGGGHYHSQSPEGFFCHVPGLKVVVPRDPYQAKGLLLAAIRDPNPVLFFEPKKLYRSAQGEVPENDYELPLGKADCLREGCDITLLGWGAMVPVLLEAASGLESDGISCEVLDLCTLLPWDRERVMASVMKTGRAVIVHEAPLTAGFGAELAASIQHDCFLNLEAPVERVTGLDTPFPQAHEQAYMPNAQRVMDTVRQSLNF